MKPFIKYYRYTVFLGALSYWTNSYFLSGFKLFHYLTNWGLTLSLICAFLLCIESTFNKPLRINSFVIATFCLNSVVMVLYWKLYFKNPDLLYAGRTPMPWYRDDYVHLLGPLSQMFDALVFKQAFRGRVFKGLVYFLVVATAYAMGSEFLFALPYPFLWDLDLGQRVGHYINAELTGMIAFFCGIVLSLLLKRAGITKSYSATVPA